RSDSSHRSSLRAAGSRLASRLREGRRLRGLASIRQLVARAEIHDTVEADEVQQFLQRGRTIQQEIAGTLLQGTLLAVQKSPQARAIGKRDLREVESDGGDLVVEKADDPLAQRF